MRIKSSAFAAAYAEFPAIVEPEHGQRAAPDATGVEANDVGAASAAIKHGPVAEQDFLHRGELLELEPGPVTGRGAIDIVLVFHVELASGGTEAQACEYVG